VTLRRRLASRCAATLVELAVVFGLLGAMATVIAISFGGGETVASDRYAQANADAAIDAAVRVYTTTGRLPDDVVTLTRILRNSPYVVNAPTPATVDRVSVALDPLQGTLAVASAGRDTSCWLVRLDVTAPADSRLRRYGVVPAGGTTPCDGTSALAMDADSGRGGSWAAPEVLP
jgi:type II secretory pathway pseudopilin PulG